MTFNEPITEITFGGESEAGEFSGRLAPGPPLRVGEDYTPETMKALRGLAARMGNVNWGEAKMSAIEDGVAEHHSADRPRFELRSACGEPTSRSNFTQPDDAHGTRFLSTGRLRRVSGWQRAGRARIGHLSTASPRRGA